MEPNIAEPMNRTNRHSGTGVGLPYPSSSVEDESTATAVGSGTFKPYSAYRPSGVEWLEEIPAHWGTLRLRFAATLNPRVSEVRRLDPDTEVSFVPMEAVGEYGGLDLSLTGELADLANGYTYFSDGDVLVAKITPCFENGKGSLAEGLLNGIAFGTTELHVIRCGPELDKRFAFYLTLGNAFRKLGEAEMYGAGGQKRVPESFVANLKHPLPPLSEQRAIAAFLYRETAKIDALVAKKERLIELLQEKRTALISKAVTKGLDPNVPMKDSGVEWLGEIPAHWNATKLRRLITQATHPLRIQPEQVYREIGIRSWGRGIFHKDPVAGVHLGDKRVFNIRPGELVLNIVFAWEGAVAVVSEDDRGMIASHRFPTFRHNGALVQLDYLLMFLQSEHGRALMGLNSPGAAGRNRTIRIDAFLDEEIPLPPLEEQREIVTTFRDNEQRLQSLSAEVRVAIDRLKEFRAALIAAAVIGSIDVREEAG